MLRTSDAAGSNSGLWWLLAATVALYAAMTAGAVTVLRSMSRRWRAGQLELPSPYGPQARLHDGVEHAGTGGPRGPGTAGRQS